MSDLRGIMSELFTKAEHWGYWHEGRRNPIAQVRIDQNWNVRPERSLTPDHLNDPNCLLQSRQSPD